MDKNHCNTAIHCTVEQCANHCCSAEYCSLDSIHVGTHEASPSVDQCTDCMSFKCKYKSRKRTQRMQRNAYTASFYYQSAA